MYLKTILLILPIIGVVQALAYRKFPSLYARAGEELDKEPQVKADKGAWATCAEKCGFCLAEFKCYYCSAASKELCVKKEKVCKQKDPICLTATGMWYILQCADMKYYEASKKECEDDPDCEVSYCTKSLCNA